MHNIIKVASLARKHSLWSILLGSQQPILRQPDLKLFSINVKNYSKLFIVLSTDLFNQRRNCFPKDTISDIFT